MVQLASELAWEDEEPTMSSSNLETSVTVDVAPFRRHLLSLSLTVHDESVASPCKGAIEKHLLHLHSTLAKLQTLTLKQPRVQAQIKSVKNAVCQLERACLHPELDSYQHSEPSTISYHCSDADFDNHNNLESYEQSKQEVSVTLDIQHQNSEMSEMSSVRPESSASGQNGHNKTTDEPLYSSLDVDMVLQQLQEPPRLSEPSLSSSVSTMLYSPPSCSAQPSKSTLRQPTNPHSPTKEVRFTLKRTHNNIKNT